VKKNVFCDGVEGWTTTVQVLRAAATSTRKFDEIVRQAHANGRITQPANVTLMGELTPCRNSQSHNPARETDPPAPRRFRIPRWVQGMP
jgi:hypothetical protein